MGPINNFGTNLAIGFKFGTDIKQVPLLIVDYKNTRYLSVNSPELFFGLFRVRVKVRVRVRVRVRVGIRVGVRVGVRVRVNSVTETNYQNRKIIRVN